jgi:serine-type D-Ala-D-Ala carboxypeptidase (penicillin-binding protein 5/6)
VKRYLLFFSCVLFLFTGLVLFAFKSNAESNKINSPIPDFLSKKDNSEVNSLDFWLPSLMSIFEDNGAPALSARSALVYDLTTEKTLYEKEPNMVLPMASITKIMTAMVAIDHKLESDRYVVYEEALVGENVMGLSKGEVLNLNELLLGVFMYSANDAAETLAINTLGRDEFIKAMNNKAKAIGLKNTNFTNPTGLQGDGNQHTSAYDLLILSKHAVENYPQIIEASSTKEKHLPATNDRYAYDMYNQLNLVTSYPGVKGLKDGFTPEAGLCLITYLDYKGHQIIGILLGSENRRQEMKDLLDYSLKQQGVEPPPHS